MGTTVEEALARRKAEQEAKAAEAAGTDTSEKSLEERMQDAIKAQQEGAKSQGVTTASTESGTAAPDLASGELKVEATRDLGANSPNPAGIAQGNISPNPALQVSQARLAEQAVIPQSEDTPSAAVAAGAGDLTPAQLERARRILGLETAAKTQNRAFRSSARTFQHLFAGAGVVTPDGRRLTFGGQPGGVGIYVTDRADDIAYLEELSHTSGSQVTEPGVTDDATKNALQEAARDARRNTEVDLNPNVQAARNSLGQTIAKND